ADRVDPSVARRARAANLVRPAEGPPSAGHKTRRPSPPAPVRRPLRPLPRRDPASPRATPGAARRVRSACPHRQVARVRLDVPGIHETTRPVAEHSSRLIARSGEDARVGTVYIEPVDARRRLAVFAATALALSLLGAGSAGADPQDPKNREAHPPHRVLGNATSTYQGGYQPSQLSAAYGFTGLA